MKTLIAKFSVFAKDRLKFERPPRLFLRNDSKNAEYILGKTAHYDPMNNAVTIFTFGRHPKDIIRSFAHELVHHCQNERGDLAPEKMKTMNNNYAQECPHMRKMEEEAYLQGNMCFRDWEDSLDNKLKYTMSIAENIYLKENKLMNKQTKKQKELSGLIGMLLEKKIRILSEQEAAPAPRAEKQTPIRFPFAKSKRFQTIIASGRGRMKIPFNMRQINALFGIEGDQYTEETYNAIANMQRRFNEEIPEGPRLAVDGIIGSNTHRVLSNIKTDNLGQQYRDLVTKARAGSVGIQRAVSGLGGTLANIFTGDEELNAKMDAAMAGSGNFDPTANIPEPMRLRRGDGPTEEFPMKADGSKIMIRMNDRMQWLRANEPNAVPDRGMGSKPSLTARSADPEAVERYQALVDWFKSTPVGQALDVDNPESIAAWIDSEEFKKYEDMAKDAMRSDGEIRVAPQGDSPQNEGKVTKAYLKSMIQKILQEKLEEELDEGSCGGGKREDKKGKKGKKKDCSKCPGCPECKPGLKKENEELEEGEISEVSDEVKARTAPRDKANKADFLPKKVRDKINKKDDADDDSEKEKQQESKIQTPEQESTLYESRFSDRNTRLYEKLLKAWTK